VPSSTVIDQLIVKLGLDPRDFTKGEKVAAAETVKLERQVKQSSEGMGRSLLGFTGKLIGIATVAVAVKKFIGYTSELSTTIRQLGIDSDNFHIAAGELRNFGNIAEMMGGKAEDVTKTVGSLSKAVYDLAYNGQISDSLIMLGRLGVQFQDSAGNMRDFKDIVLDTQSAIQQSMRNGTSRANAYQMLLQAGFDPGLANAMLKGDVSQQLNRQQQRRQVARSDIDLATKWEQSAANRGQAADAAALRQLPLEAKIGTAANDAIAAGLDKAGTIDFGNAARDMGDAMLHGGKAVKDGVTDFLLGLGRLADRMGAKNLPRGRAAYEGTIQAAAKRFGINPEVLAGVLHTESGFNPGAYNEKSGATGIAQLLPKYFPGAGKDPNKDINTAAEYLSKLHESEMKQRGLGNEEAWKTALEDYNAGQTRVHESTAPGGKPLTKETQDYPGKVLDYAAGAQPSPGAQAAATVHNRTDITFESVNINTTGKDGERIATDFTDSTRRKLLAAQADTGTQ
jgi:soluble lytic murein transglycosylase-like protein